MTTEAIATVRRFNRTVTRRIGVLSDPYLGGRRPLGQARVLYEIGVAGAEVRAVRARLGLDSGYLSRLLRALEREELVESSPQPGDARVRCLRLTVRGVAELEELDRRADALAVSVLEPLAAVQREQLTAAMAQVDRLLTAAAVTLAPEPQDGEAAQWCLQQFTGELNRLFDGGFDPARSISVDIDPPEDRASVFLVARLDNAPVGCGMLKSGAVGWAAIKRMWVAGSARRLGLGRRILGALEDHARAQGVRTLRLETNRALGPAIALYRASGYREVEPFSDEFYAHHWFEKTLDA